MKKLRFSIVVPVYKVEKYIRRCLNSLINQTFRSIEILLVDDGSPDACPDICDEYARHYEFVRAFHKKNEGLSCARNFGLERAEGEFVAFVDSDDYIDLETCQKFNDIVVSNADRTIDVIAANVRVVGDSSQDDEIHTPVKGISTGQEFLRTQLKRKTIHVSACRNVYRRQFLIENGLFFKCGILHEDQQWTPRVFLKAETVISTPYVFYFYSIREGSITQQTVKTRNASDFTSIYREMREFYRNLEDTELRNLLLEYLVNLYLEVFYMWKLLVPIEKTDRRFLKDDAKTISSKSRVRLFLLNRRLYYFYLLIRRNYLNRIKVKQLLKRKARDS